MMHGYMIHDGVPALGAEFNVQLIQLCKFEQEGIQCSSFSLPLGAFLLQGHLLCLQCFKAIDQIRPHNAGMCPSSAGKDEFL